MLIYCSFYGGPIRGILSDFRRRNVLQHVQIMVLDGLSVTFELISEIIFDKSYDVRLLSVRECQNLNERKLMQALEYAVRPSRPENTPRLKGLYIFGKKDAARPHVLPSIRQVMTGGVTGSMGAQIGSQWNQKSEEAQIRDLEWQGDKWYGPAGMVLNKTITNGWAQTINACKGMIAFDAVLCGGPRHIRYQDSMTQLQPWYTDPEAYLIPTIAQFVVGKCTGCERTPIGSLIHGESSPESFPLLVPPPRHAATVRAATRPNNYTSSEPAQLIPRCQGM